MSEARYHSVNSSCRHIAQVVLVLLLLLGDAALLLPPAQAKPASRPAQVIVETRLRAEPSKRGKPLLRIPAGTSISIKGAPEDGWYRAHHGRLDGYVRSGDVATDLAEDEADLEQAEADLQPGEVIDDPGDVSLEQVANDTGAADTSARSGKSDKGAARHGRKGRDHRSKSSRKHDRKKQRKDARARSGMQSTRVVAATDLNLRADPDSDAPVSATMPRGDQAMPTGEQQDGWVEVSWDGETGWALGRHLAVLPPAASDSGDTAWSREELKAIIYEAADRYGQPREDMLRVARCESDMIPSAVNPYGGSYGLYQFKPGTWLSTPYAAYDIFDPRASANTAAWMWSVGRRREWVCQ